MGYILKLHVIAAIVVIVNGVQTVSVSDTPACQEDSTGVNYRGNLSQTINGHNCQAWTSQDPHQHFYTPADFPNAGLDDNYCRSPDNDDTAWCYTTNHGIIWEYCDVGFLDPRCKALHDVNDVCLHITTMSCPLITLESGETVQLIPKPMQSDLDWLISDLPADLQIPDDVQRYYCTEPGSICMQNPRNVCNSENEKVSLIYEGP
ncbi:putative apolipoprotein(a)-like protein 2 [Strongylocentrotus purpuratus]|uniref:Kringle domain-containing protein n=1 Tax=Strongylocentrotus purpuratus TaxID=7668 RepID=A0A7M7PJZ8_STRPU|nr:putative apolipoprotein(a)-like protein 2 [Strongylocentrotus purpuratus]